MMAGALIVQEAGGRVTGLDGSPGTRTAATSWRRTDTSTTRCSRSFARGRKFKDQQLAESSIQDFELRCLDGLELIS